MYKMVMGWGRGGEGDGVVINFDVSHDCETVCEVGSSDLSFFFSDQTGCLY